MRRWTAMAAAVLGFLLLPSAGTELSDLHPAELLYVSTERNAISVQTDTGDYGRGETLEAAFRDMAGASRGVISLDTVERLLITDEAIYLLPQLRDTLRPTVRVCKVQGQQDTEAAAVYLRTHVPERKLSRIQDKKELQYLQYKEGRYTLEYQ